MNLKNRNILFFTSETYPAFAGDGRNALLFAGVLRGKGFKTCIVCLNPNGILQAGEVVNGVKIYRIKYLYNYLWSRAITRVLMAIQLLKIQRSYRYWIIYGGMPCHRLIVVFGHMFGKKVIFRSTLWCFDDVISLCNGKMPVVRSLKKHLLGLTSAYFALNENFSRSWAKELGYTKPIFVSTQGVDCSLFRYNIESRQVLRESLGIRDDDFVILLQGHLIRRKGFVEVFEWMSMLNFGLKVVHVGRSSAPNWDIVSTKNMEMAQVMDYGKSILGDSLIFIGETNNVAQYMGIADAFMLNSASEGFPPNSLSEAMASGLPSLIRRMEGINSNMIIDGETAMLYTGFEEFNNKLMYLVQNKVLRKQIGANARKMMLKYNDINLVAQHFIEFLETNLP